MGWSQPSNPLSIPDDGWNATTGELTVSKSGNGHAGPKEWGDLLSNAGIAAGSVQTLILTGNFSNNDINDITNDGIMKKIVGENNNNTIYLNLKDCNNVTSDLTTTRTTVTREESISFSLYSSPVTFYDGNGNVVTNPDTNQQYTGTANNQQVTFKYVNGSWVADFGSYQAPLDEVRNLTFKDADGNVISNDVLKQGELTPNPNGTWTFIQRTKSGGTISFGNYKNKINGIYFPENENFKYVPKDLCKEISSLQSITLPDNIIIIEENAFQQCSNLGDFTFPQYIEEIGIDAFQKCNSLTTLDFRGLNNLWKIDASAFDMGSSSSYNLVNIYLPEEDNTTLTFVGNWVFGGSNVKKLDFSHCLGIKHFAYDGANYFDESIYTGSNAGSTKTFYWYDKLEEIILPPNLELVAEGCFQKCTNLKVVEFKGVAKKENGTLTNGLVIAKQAFQDDLNLTTIKFANNSNLYKINEGAFQRTGLTDVNVSMCHELILIDKDAFSTCTSLASVTVCSHPKTIVGGQGSGAFYNCKAIRRVEVTACDGITDITQCVCQCGAFDQDITYHGTDANFDNIKTDCAVLVFPETAPVVNPYTDDTPYYTSAFDFFVGDYKTGTLITQTGLNGLHKGVPNSANQSEYKVNDYDENGNKIGEHMVYYSVPYQVGDGWHEFIMTEYGTVIKKEEDNGRFLRTYSRSVGAGPCILPTTIAAYRAVDYMTDDHDWVEDKSGKYYCADENADPKVYQLIPETNGVFDAATLQLIQENGYKRYSFLTIGGKVYLKRLNARQACLKDNENQAIPYDDNVYYEDVNLPEEEQRTNKQYYDEQVFSGNTNVAAVPGGYSYVPENTGVVLYSKRVNEDYLLVLGGYFGTETVLPEYPHTGHRYEADRANSDDTRNNINMLQGTFDVKTLVSPVFPWFGQNHTTGKGGSYNDNIQPREYRNFAFNKSEMKWLRLKPCIAADNFAFASIPVERFDNFNESHAQMPGFLEEDLNGAEANSSNYMLINLFEDEEGSAADGIKVVNSVIVNANNNAWYTLQGVRVAQPNKGVYIHNGKKVVIK